MVEIPSSMQAVVGTPSGPRRTERRTVDVPAAGPGEVLLRVRTFSVNRGELTLLRRVMLPLSLNYSMAPSDSAAILGRRVGS